MSQDAFQAATAALKAVGQLHFALIGGAECMPSNWRTETIERSLDELRSASEELKRAYDPDRTPAEPIRIGSIVAADPLGCTLKLAQHVLWASRDFSAFKRPRDIEALCFAKASSDDIADLETAIEVLRRKSGECNVKASPPAQRMREGVPAFALRDKILYLDGKPLALTKGEKDILALLVRHKAATLSELRNAHDTPHKVLAGLLRKYPRLKPYLFLPGKPARGGYRTTIEPIDEHPRATTSP